MPSSPRQRETEPPLRAGYARHCLLSRSIPLQLSLLVCPAPTQHSPEDPLAEPDSLGCTLRTDGDPKARMVGSASKGSRTDVPDVAGDTGHSPLSFSVFPAQLATGNHSENG